MGPYAYKIHFIKCNGETLKREVINAVKISNNPGFILSVMHHF